MNHQVPASHDQLDFVLELTLFDERFGDANSPGITDSDNCCLHDYNVITLCHHVKLDATDRGIDCGLLALGRPGTKRQRTISPPLPLPLPALRPTKDQGRNDEGQFLCLYLYLFLRFAVLSSREPRLAPSPSEIMIMSPELCPRNYPANPVPAHRDRGAGHARPQHQHALSPLRPLLLPHQDRFLKPTIEVRSALSLGRSSLIVHRQFMLESARSTIGTCQLSQGRLDGPRNCACPNFLRSRYECVSCPPTFDILAVCIVPPTLGTEFMPNYLGTKRAVVHLR